MVGFFLPFVPMILVSGTIYYQFCAAYDEKIRAQVMEVTQKGRRDVDRFFREQLEALRAVSATHSVEELSGEPVLRGIFSNLQGMCENAFEELALIDDRGNCVAYAGPGLTPKPLYAGGHWLREAMHRGHAIHRESTGPPGSAKVAIAVKKEEGGGQWVLWSTMADAPLSRLMRDASTGSSGTVCLLDAEKQCIISGSQDLSPEECTLLGFPNIGDTGRDEILLTQYRDGLGRKSIATVALLKECGWTLVTRHEATDAFHGLTKAKTVTVGAIVLAGLLIAANAFGLSKKTVRRLALADARKQKTNEQMLQTGKLASIGELAAGIAHEINNPVAIMVEEAGWIDDLLEEDEFRESDKLDEVRRASRQIRAQGKRCKEITHKLLSFARETDFRVQPVQLGELIEDTTAMAVRTADAANVTIAVDVQEDLPELCLPRTEVQQVLLNLVKNALDALENQGGTVSISVRLSMDLLTIRVSDSGLGIPEEDLKRIFDPFYTTKPVGKGTGLGLSICYGIVGKMGGEIGVESSMGTGTTFRVVIPIPAEEQDEAQ